MGRVREGHTASPAVLLCLLALLGGGAFRGGAAARLRARKVPPPAPASPVDTVTLASGMVNMDQADPLHACLLSPGGGPPPADGANATQLATAVTSSSADFELPPFAHTLDDGATAAFLEEEEAGAAAADAQSRRGGGCEPRKSCASCVASRACGWLKCGGSGFCVAGTDKGPTHNPLLGQSYFGITWTHSSSGYGAADCNTQYSIKLKTRPQLWPAPRQAAAPAPPPATPPPPPEPVPTQPPPPAPKEPTKTKPAAAAEAEAAKTKQAPPKPPAPAQQPKPPPPTVPKKEPTNLCLNGNLAPQFILIGAQKCATSSFAHEFIKGTNVVHPEIGWEPKKGWHLFQKELTYFNHPLRYAKGTEFWLSHYPTCPPEYAQKHEVATDFTPSYLSTFEAPGRIIEKYGPQKDRITFLVLLREPLSRMQSSFYHGISSKFVAGNYTNFQTYVEAAIEAYGKGEGHYLKFHDTVCDGYPVTDPSLRECSGIPFSLSFYYPQLENWLKFFKASQFVVAPMKTYFRHTSPKDQELVSVIADRVGATFLSGSIKEVTTENSKPRLNVHSHPEEGEDLDAATTAKIQNIFTKETGPEKLAGLLSAKQKEGLTLFNFHGDPTDHGAIANWLSSNW